MARWVRAEPGEVDPDAKDLLAEFRRRVLRDLRPDVEDVGDGRDGVGRGGSAPAAVEGEVVPLHRET
jgi:hypothetical protein